MQNVKLSRDIIIEKLIERDGNSCFICKKEFSDKSMITLDHWYPVSWCRQNGWTEEQIWDLSNLRLAEKKCNARKGDTLPNDDGTITLPERKRVTTRKIKRELRPEMCDTCMNGRILLPGETCPDCSSGPQPAMAPRALQVSPKDCSHEGAQHCWLCYLGFVERKSAIQDIIMGPK